MGRPVAGAERVSHELDLYENAWRAQLAPPGAHRASVADLRVFTSTAGDQVMAELVLTLDSGHRSASSSPSGARRR